MAMTYEQLEKCIYIAKNKLDAELEVQPTYMLSVTDGLAEAKAHTDAAKDHLAQVAASVADTLREDDPKISETKIQSLLPNDPSYRKAQTAYRAAQYRQARYEGLYEAFRQRGSMLKTLADLFIASYYTVDRVLVTSSSVSQGVSAAQGRSAMQEARQGVVRRSFHKK